MRQALTTFPDAEGDPGSSREINFWAPGSRFARPGEVAGTTIQTRSVRSAPHPPFGHLLPARGEKEEQTDLS